MATTLGGPSLLSEFERSEDVALSPVERVLLVTDGTVTQLLEALAREPIDVHILDRSVADSTLERRVVLRGAEAERGLVWAESEVFLSRLDDELADELAYGDRGIGSLLKRELAETRREVRSVRLTAPGEPDCPTFVDAEEGAVLARSYRIYSDDECVMEITEYFPRARLSALGRGA